MEISPHRNRFSGRNCDPTGELTPEQFVPDGLQPVERTHAGETLELQPMGMTMLEKLVKVCILWEGSHTEAGEKCEQEGVAKMNCYELTATPFPHRPCAAQDGRR